MRERAMRVGAGGEEGEGRGAEGEEDASSFGFLSSEKKIVTRKREIGKQ
jgi:hypothetical protein